MKFAIFLPLRKKRKMKKEVSSYVSIRMYYAAERGREKGRSRKVILYGEQVFKAFKTQKVNTWKMNIFLNINRYVFFVNLINMQFLYSTLY